MYFARRRFAAPVLLCMALATVGAIAMPSTRAEMHKFARATGIAAAQHPARVNEAVRSMRYTALDGSSVNLAAGQRGTYVYNVFTTWCPSCREELPAFSKLARRLQARGVKVVGIDQAEAAPKIADFAREQGLAYPVVIDADRTSNAVLGANLIPTTVVVRDGIVRAQWSGPLAPGDLERLVNAAL